MEYIGKIQGVPPSKSNAYRIVTSPKGYATLTKTNAMHKYEETFLWQVGAMRGAMIDVPFRFELDVYYPSKRSDLDGSFKGILDCLQKAKVIKNDNNCYDIHARKFIDKENPRIEFKIIID
jgi:Holliday junction resolvase RusA-like endonuclease